MARGLDISVCEFVAFEQQRLTFGLCKRIAKQSAEIQFRSPCQNRDKPLA
jgi:hypothetical protein